MATKENGDMFIGSLIGAFCMFLIWMACNDIAEQQKTLNGFLTYHGVRYTVTEYDRLDIPPKPEKKSD
jgi:hypothetical protein